MIIKTKSSKPVEELVLQVVELVVENGGALLYMHNLIMYLDLHHQFHITKLQIKIKIH